MVLFSGLGEGVADLMAILEAGEEYKSRVKP